MAKNQSIPHFRPGADISVKASGAVTGKTFVQFDGAMDPVAGTLATAKTADGSKFVFGVAAYDAAAGEVFPVIVGPGHITNVTCAAALAYGTYVKSDAFGRAIAATDRATAVGVATSTSSAAGQDVFVKLF